MDENDLFVGRTVFSGAEAAQYVGIPWGTFKNHVFVRGLIPNSKTIGNRRCFTRSQLDEYRLRRVSQRPFDVDDMTIDQASEYLGMSRAQFSRYLYGDEYARRLPFQRVGGSGLSNRGGEKKGGIILFTVETLDRFRDEVLGGGVS